MPHCRGVIDADLIDHVAATTGLTPSEARRVVEDVVAWYAEPVQDYVRRRHRDLQTHGVRNPQAFERIAAELAQRVTAPPQLSQRQLRRIVYG